MKGVASLLVYLFTLGIQLKSGSGLHPIDLDAANLEAFAMPKETVKIENARDPGKAAQLAGLRYVNDSTAGFQRAKSGKGFKYRSASGGTVTDESVLARIKRLAIPPAWTDVWVCSYENGHIQATGRDAKGRKQHRDHPRWREVRDENKYFRMMQFAKALPKVRKRVEQDLARGNLPREKVLAVLVKILETGLIRVGNEEYERQNHSYGLTTLKDRHAKISGAAIRFQFKGKSGKEHAVNLTDARVSKIVKRCQELPGQELFQYRDEDGNVQDITSTDVNDYLREVSGGEFTAKDFRTWAGTVLAAMALQEYQKFDSQAQAKKNVVKAIESVAKQLGNTPTICRKCYIHPAIIDAYFNGNVIAAMKVRARKQFARAHKLRPEEGAVLALLQERLAAEERERKTPLTVKLQKSIRAYKKQRKMAKRA
jgi:DNA topoisomerase-1